MLSWLSYMVPCYNEELSLPDFYTKWSLWKRSLHELQGIIAFSTVFLAVTVMMGVEFCVFVVGMAIFVIVRALTYGDPIDGLPSLVCSITFFSRLQLFCTGVLRQYQEKNYSEMNKRPLVIVGEENEVQLDIVKGEIEETLT